MKWWERFSVPIGRRIASPYTKVFEGCSPETVLRKAADVIDRPTLEEIKAYIVSAQTPSGGFADKADKADVYYTLFGILVAAALDMRDRFPAVGNFIEREMNQPHLSDIHLHCVAISGTLLGIGRIHDEPFRSSVRKLVQQQIRQDKTYPLFLSLLTCFYIRDYPGLYTIRRKLGRVSRDGNLPCTVLAALVVLEVSFHKPATRLTEQLLGFYDGRGGFRATQTAPVSDLLSTAVALYALRFAGADLRRIRASCLEFVDALYTEGGFSATLPDHDTDIEYTFYGLLALGALATPYESN